MGLTKSVPYCNYEFSHLGRWSNLERTEHAGYKASIYQIPHAFLAISLTFFLWKLDGASWYFITRNYSIFHHLFRNTFLNSSFDWDFLVSCGPICGMTVTYQWTICTSTLSNDRSFNILTSMTAAGTGPYSYRWSSRTVAFRCSAPGSTCCAATVRWVPWIRTPRSGHRCASAKAVRMLSWPVWWRKKEK